MKNRMRRLLMAVFCLLVFILFAVTAKAETIKPITMDEIQREMAKGSPYEIIKDCDGMVFINYDEKDTWKQKYFKEVFQEGETDKKPVLVLFYDLDRKGVAYNLRGSIIYKELNKKYNNKLKFLAINLPWKEKNSEYHKMTLDAKSYHGKGLGIFSTSEGKRMKQLPPIKGAPSTAMYSPWEVLEGETSSNNDMHIKLLDISLGAPYKDEDIPDLLYSGDDALINWVEYNIFNNPGYTYRENNSASSFNKIEINKKTVK